MADRYAGKAGYGLQRQVCLAHLLRDAQFAIDAGDEHFAPNLHWLLLRALAIARRRERLQDSTLARYRADLDRRLNRLFATPPTTRAGRRLARGVAVQAISTQVTTASSHVRLVAKLSPTA